MSNGGGGGPEDALTTREGLNFALKHLESDLEIFTALDTKLGLIAGFSLASVAEVLGLLMLGTLEPGTSSQAPILAKVSTLSYVGMGLALATSVSALWGLAAKPYSRAVALDDLANPNSGDPARLQLTAPDLLKGAVTASKDNKVAQQFKSRCLKWSLVFACLTVSIYATCAAIIIMAESGHQESFKPTGSSAGVRLSASPQPADQSAKHGPSPKGSFAGAVPLAKPQPADISARHR